MQMDADDFDGDLTHHPHNQSFDAMCGKVASELEGGRLFWREKSIVEVGGWNGVGRRRVLQRVVHILTTPSSSSSSTTSEPPAFPHLVRMPKQEDEAEIRRRIRERLLLDNSVGAYDSSYAFGSNWIRLLRDSSQYLLVVIEQDLTRHINPEAIIEQRETPVDPWIKIVAPVRPPPGDEDGDDDHQSMPTTNSGYAEHMFGEFEDLPPEDAWELLQYEIAEIAEELRRPGSDQRPSLQWNQQLRFSGHISGDADIITECFLYAGLFMTPIDFPLYLWCEGCRTTTTTTTYTDFSDFVGLLLNKLRERSLLSAKGTIRRPLLNTVLDIATTLPSRIKKKGRFMVQINKGLKEFPSPPTTTTSTIDHGEHARGVTRISLQSNQIERLQHLLPSLADDDDNSSHSQGTSHNTLLPNTPDPSSLDYYDHLSTLILSFNPMSEGIQSDFFQPENANVTIMPNLRVLDLSFCEQLESLPTSIQSLVNLRLLNLTSCTNLKTISSCLEQTDALPNLQVLEITDCPLQEMTKASFRSMPNLWLILSNEQTLVNVEMLDFSSTKIKTFPDLLSGSSRQTLNHLLLIETKNLSSVYWDRFTEIPKSILWDQCGCCTPINTINDTRCFRICVEDVRIFMGLSQNHSLWHQIDDFQEFHIHIRPCIGQRRQHSSPNHPSPRHQHHHHGRHPCKREYPSSPYYKNLLRNNNIPKRKQVQEYVDEDQFVSDDASSNPATASKYLHICGVPTNFSVSIQGVLPHIHFLQLCNCYTIKHLRIIDNMRLRSCQVIKCPSMEKLFYLGPYFYSETDISRLESIELFHLINLRTLYEGYFYPFRGLKRVFVDSCPRLVVLFPSTPQMYVFTSLEELVIKSCGKLRDIFGEGANGEEEVAPMLKSLYLQDLPELRRVCDGYLKSLKSVQLRGCFKLGKLPIHDGDTPPPEVSAKTKWWEKLSEEDKKHISNFRPRPTSHNYR